MPVSRGVNVGNSMTFFLAVAGFVPDATGGDCGGDAEFCGERADPNCVADSLSEFQGELGGHDVAVGGFVGCVAV